MLSYGTALGEQLEVQEFILRCKCPVCHEQWQGGLFLTVEELKLPPTTIAALCVTCAEKHLEAIAKQTAHKWAFEPIKVDSFPSIRESIEFMKRQMTQYYSLPTTEQQTPPADHCDCAPAGWGDLWGHKPTCNTQRGKQ